MTGRRGQREARPRAEGPSGTQRSTDERSVGGDDEVDELLYDGNGGGRGSGNRSSVCGWLMQTAAAQVEAAQESGGQEDRY